jgi:hypothetical protein
MSAQDHPAQDRVETRIQFRAGDKLFAFLALRAARTGTPSADLQARAEIEIWREVMATELRRIPLTLGEASCLAGILKGHRPSRGPVSASIGICYAECEQAFRLAREIADQAPAGTWWGISEDVLLAKLQRLGPAADLALEDAIARWHDRHFEATADGFGQAGLRIISPPAGHRDEPYRDKD